jgi:ABC-type transporter Mla subunit MlaD
LDEFLVPASFLNVYANALDAVPPSTMELHRHYARLQADLKRARQPASGEIRQENPFLPTYQKAKADAAAFAITVRDLEQKFQQATGAERMQIEDELRDLRGKGVDVQRAFASARDRYDRWNTEHPSAENLSRPAVTQLEAELATVAAQIKNPAGTP